MNGHKHVCAMAWAILILMGGSQSGIAQSYIGYVDAEYLRATATAAGRVMQTYVQRGQTLKAGDLVAGLDDTLERAQRDEAQGRLAQAEAQLADLEFARRQPEIDAIIAQRNQAQAQLNLSRAQVERQRALARTGVASHEILDQAVMAVTRDEARVKELDSQLSLAHQTTGRDQAIQAARANVATSRAVLDQANWHLAERTIRAASAGQVDVPTALVGPLDANRFQFSAREDQAGTLPGNKPGIVHASIGMAIEHAAGASPSAA